jgi:hypothetical protein
MKVRNVLLIPFDLVFYRASSVNILTQRPFTANERRPHVELAGAAAAKDPQNDHVEAVERWGAWHTDRYPEWMTVNELVDKRPNM